MQENNNGNHSEQNPNQKSKRNKILKTVTAIVLSLAALGLSFGYGIYCSRYFQDEHLKSFLWFKKNVQDHYWQEIGDDEFWDAAIDGVEQNLLDPYSEFLSRDEFDEKKDSDRGLMDGLGISFFHNTNKVVEVAINSPAFFAAVQTGIPIEKGMSVTGIGANRDSLVNTFDSKSMQTELAKYKEKETVWMRFSDRDVTDEQSLSEAENSIVSVNRASYTQSYVLYAANGKAWAYLYGEKNGWSDVSEYVRLDERVSGDVAVLQFSQFNAEAAREFEAALEQFKKDGVATLLLDLRNNGGGSVQIMQQISSFFLKDATEQNSIVMTAQYRNGVKQHFTASESRYFEYFKDKKIYVAGNRNTASASEALIGAMISYGAIDYSDVFVTKMISADASAVARTYGKGIMQQFFIRPTSGEAVKLTTAQIYWPNGTSIHGKGITSEDGARISLAHSNGDYGDEELINILKEIGGSVL